MRLWRPFLPSCRFEEAGGGEPNTVKYVCSIEVEGGRGDGLEALEAGQDRKSVEKMLSLKDIVPAAQNNINTRFILLDKGRTKLDGQSKICLALVADETASVHFLLSGDECDAFEPKGHHPLDEWNLLLPEERACVEGRQEGNVEKVGEFTVAFVETPNMSEIRWVPDSNDPKKYIQEAVICNHSHVFPPLS